MSQPSLAHLDPASIFRLLDVTRKLAVPMELRDLLTLVIDVGRDVLKADRGSVFLYDQDSSELHTLVATGEQEIRFSVSQGIAGECARTRQPINVPDCYADPRFNKAIDLRTGYHTRALIAVPLIGLEDELVGVMQLLNPQKASFDAGDERIAAALASQAAVAIQRAVLIEERIVKLKLEADLDIARQIQRNVLPDRLPPCDGYDLACFNEPADQTGGDIYDIISLDPAKTDAPVVIMFADATGHGIGPALSATQFRAMLRVGLMYCHDLEDLIAKLNRQLAADLASNRFITAFVGMLDPTAHVVRYQAPGQGPLLHFRSADSSCDWLAASSVPLGIMDDPPMEAPESIHMAPGDMLVLLTDGFYEYQNGAGQQFDREGVARVIAEHRHESAEQIIARLLDALRTFAGDAPQADDLTAILLKRRQ